MIKQTAYKKIENSIHKLIDVSDKDHMVRCVILSIEAIMIDFNLNFYDHRLKDAFLTAKAYLDTDFIKVGKIKEHARICHHVARLQTDLKNLYVARIIGQGISTIHVKTHALGIFYYLEKLLRHLDYKDDDIDSYLNKLMKNFKTTSKE
ncbi:MAG: hypothetical protein RBT45_04505 [Acholeplasmataceae bacterium]|jgi:hypothetical protein|nr:hypothetical protein [Acholeplasmataceae bacterium]